MSSEDFSNLDELKDGQSVSVTDEEPMSEILAKSCCVKSFTEVAKAAGTHDETCGETSLLHRTTNEDVPVAVEADPVPLILVSVNKPDVPDHEKLITLDVLKSGLNTTVTYHEENCDETSLNRASTNLDDRVLEFDTTSLIGQTTKRDVPVAVAVEADPVPLILASVNESAVRDHAATDTSYISQDFGHDKGIPRKAEGPVSVNVGLVELVSDMTVEFELEVDESELSRMEGSQSDITDCANECLRDGTLSQEVNCFDLNEDVNDEGMDCLNPVSVDESCSRSKQMPDLNITEGGLDGATNAALADGASIEMKSNGAFKYEWDLNVADGDDSHVISSDMELTSESMGKTVSSEGQFKFDLNSIPVDDDSQSSDGWLNHGNSTYHPTPAPIWTKQPWPTAFNSLFSGNKSGYAGSATSSCTTTWMMKRKETDWALRLCSSKRQHLML